VHAELLRCDQAAASCCAAAARSAPVAGVAVLLKASCSDSWTSVALPLGRQEASLVVWPAMAVESAVQARTVSSLRSDVWRVG
jgi:hypothetical protein